MLCLRTIEDQYNPWNVVENHFTFDKGKSDCEVLLYLMTMEKVFLFPYAMESGVFYSKVFQVVETRVFYGIIM